MIFYSNKTNIPENPKPRCQSQITTSEPSGWFLCNEKNALIEMTPKQIGKTTPKAAFTEADNFEVFSCILNTFSFF